MFDYAEDTLKDDFARVLQTQEGRNFVAWILSSTDVARSVYQADHVKSAFCAGRQSVGLAVLAMIAEQGPMAVPDFLHQITLEKENGRNQK